MEEGATNEDLDLDDDNHNNDAMDVVSDEDDIIVYVTAGGIPPPPPLLTRWSGRGSCRVTMTPPSSFSHREKKM